jgi:cytochrome c oxidase assembly protein subunit 15
LCGAVVLLVFAGAMVTSHDAGLSVPDWPTTYGQNMFLFPPSRWVGGIFYEHVHRLIASCIGVLTVILAVAMWRLERRPWTRVLAYCALGAVIIQGVLGGLTVKLLLPPSVSVAHALLAQTFFVLTIVIAYAESAEFAERRAGGDRGDRALLAWALAAAGAVYLQLFIGAIMRHTGAGLAVPDFPTSGDGIIPPLSGEALAHLNAMRAQIGLTTPVEGGQVAIHLVHRYWALVVLAVTGRLAFVSMPWDSRARKTARAAALVALFQFALGVLTIQSVRNPVITSVHVVIGALLLGLTALAALRAWMPAKS